jgi:LemA protein
MNRTRFAALALAPVAIVSLSGCGINSIPTAEENVKARWADVQTEYQRRSDLIPNLVATVQGYAKHEKDVLTQVTEARAKATSIQISAGDLTDPNKVRQFEQAQNQLGGLTARLIATAERYPELKADTNFLALQSQIEGTENRISRARSDYNNAVQGYNTRIRTFPDVVGAKVFYGSKPMVPFQAITPNADKAPKVDFSGGNAAH